MKKPTKDQEVVTLHGVGLTPLEIEQVTGYELGEIKKILKRNGKKIVWD